MRAGATAPDREQAGGLGQHWAWLAPLLIIAVTFAAWSFLPVEVWIQSFVTAVKNLGPLGVAGFTLLYILGTLVLAPASVMSIAAGLAFGLWGIPFVILVGTTAAGLAFLLARHAARERFERLLNRRPLFRAIGRAIEEEGWRVVGLVRLSPPIPFGVTNYVFGVTRVGFWPFVLTTAAGILPATLIYVNLGMLGHAIGTGGTVAVWQWALLGVGLVAGLGAGVLVARKTRRHLAADAEEHDTPAARHTV